MATITYEVTVATGTNWYSANANKYYINGEVAPLLYLQEGNTYIFNQNNASNSGHPLRFSSTKDGTHQGGVAYTTGVTTTGTPGTSGANTTIGFKCKRHNDTNCKWKYFCWTSKGFRNLLCV
jgi:hypothetical protein